MPFIVILYECTDLTEQTAVVAVSVGQARCGNNIENSGDNPRVGAP